MKERFEDFAVSMIKAGKLIQKIKNIEMQDYHLKAIHSMILYYLNEHIDGLSNSDLVKLIQEDKAAISRALKELLDKNYIVYQSHDMIYHTKIILTDAGKKIAVELDEKAIRAVQVGGNGLSEEERTTFYNALHLITSNLEAYYQVLNKEK